MLWMDKVSFQHLGDQLETGPHMLAQCRFGSAPVIIANGIDDALVIGNDAKQSFAADFIVGYFLQCHHRRGHRIPQAEQCTVVRCGYDRLMESEV